VVVGEEAFQSEQVVVGEDHVVVASLERQVVAGVVVVREQLSFVAETVHQIG
jgi:hypothetical protein